MTASPAVVRRAAAAAAPSCGGRSFPRKACTSLVTSARLSRRCNAAGEVQVTTAAVFLQALRARGQRPGGISLVWGGLPALSDFAPFADVAWKLFTRTLFKMGAFASISSVAMGLPFNAAATHQVCASFVIRNRSDVPRPSPPLACVGVASSQHVRVHAMGPLRPR